MRVTENSMRNGCRSVDDYKKHEEQLTECRQYTVEELFCSGYARYFWEAIKIRYPELVVFRKPIQKWTEPQIENKS